jgi:hypothetical protein
VLSTWIDEIKFEMYASTATVRHSSSIDDGNHIRQCVETSEEKRREEKRREELESSLVNTINARKESNDVMPMCGKAMGKMHVNAYCLFMSLSSECTSLGADENEEEEIH